MVARSCALVREDRGIASSILRDSGLIRPWTRLLVAATNGLAHIRKPDTCTPLTPNVQVRTAGWIDGRTTKGTTTPADFAPLGSSVVRAS
eukprot:CAMPEP_0185195488 /NCGR_PEP_ID=MMETSP1140-20130426/34721_1 /TAXON_ID=298111 /ORGANISM="Pavlova sp., Strain CCMP459" /LENGTH=89 /DNA_ID=CAMNT_0027762463 /DNA_START=83 /DNA_END=352 /DNA_ORIENTATION=-